MSHGKPKGYDKWIYVHHVCAGACRGPELEFQTVVSHQCGQWDQTCSFGKALSDLNLGAISPDPRKVLTKNKKKLFLFIDIFIL